jgi:predicted lipoprotein with Yx(FWY)xxD motif
MAAAACGIAVLLLAGACGSGATNGAAGTPLPSVTATPKQGKPVLSATRSASLGAIVVDSTGHTLYRFDEDTAKPPRVTCAGPCEKKWPPALAGDETSTKGVELGLVGRVKRPDGRWQLTLAGWPLYRYAGDRRSGDIKGQNEDGVWFAIAPNGTKAARDAASGTAGGGGAGGAAGGTSTKWGPLSAADRELVVRLRQAWLWQLPAAEQAGRRARGQAVKTAGKQLAAQRGDLEDEVRSRKGVRRALREPDPRRTGHDARVRRAGAREHTQHSGQVFRAAGRGDGDGTDDAARAHGFGRRRDLGRQVIPVIAR